jgi:type IV secretory pathway TraG/TraD family ATPase VirD4
MHNLTDTAGTFVRWDLLKEAFVDKHPETYLLEFSKMVFKEAMESSKEPFFPTSAMLVFYSQLYHLYKYYADTKNPLPSTKSIISTIRKVTDSQIIASVNKHQDYLGGIKNLINKTDATRDVRAVLESTLSNIFTLNSNFCADHSNFSIRQFIRSPIDNKRLFIVYDFNHRESSGNMARILLDLAIKEVIGSADLLAGDTTRYNFLLDEFAYLPSGLNYLEPSLNFGRSKGLRLYGGLQNYSQLSDLYGGRDYTANSTFAGFSNIVCLKPNDEKSINAIVSRAGKEDTTVTTCSALGEVSTKLESMNTISDQDLTSLDIGDAVVLLDHTSQGNRPFWFHFNP